MHPRLWLLVALLLASGCSSAVRAPSAAPAALPEPRPVAVADSYWEQYLAAVEAARYPDRSKISKDLLPLLPGEDGLDWRDGRVRMVNWTRAEYYRDTAYVSGHEFSLYGDTWFTVYPVVRDFCRRFRGDDLAMRLRQLIGLPPDAGDDAFLEVWVRPEDLFRPCPDPEITDSQCQVEIPLVDHPPPPRDGENPPWYCPPLGVAPWQQGGRFQLVFQTHLSWMCENWESSYTNEDPKRDYPWTALGYTYDWGQPEDPRGPSEYVALQGTRVVFERLETTAAYCGRR